MQKQILAYLLLFLFLFNTMGYFFIFEMNKYLVKREMRIAIRQQPREYATIEVFKADQNRDLERVEKHEIRYKGNMYDIISEVKKGDITTFYCLRDHKEEMIAAGLKKVNKTRFSQTLQDHLVKIALPLQILKLRPPVAVRFTFRTVDCPSYIWVLNTWSPPPELF